MTYSLSDFHLLRPAYEMDQPDLLKWTARAHARAEAKVQNWSVDGAEYQGFFNEIYERLLKLGFGKGKIEKRGSVLRDSLHEQWDRMEIYNLDTHPEGYNFQERSAVFDQYCSRALDDFYPSDHSGCSHLVHVSCTGYVAPSPAQKMVAKRGWGGQIAVTHAYHMGCYAAIPAIRIGKGYLSIPSPSPTERVDIVHTELCSLHMNPLLHQTEQLVVQSLFADGFIKYSVVPLDGLRKPGLQILALHEELIPDSSELMTWACASWGLKMSISKEVPMRIGKALELFMHSLAEKGHASWEEIRSHALYAIHPGGPKIIRQVAQVLGLKPEQVRHSEEVLRQYGNMSSATLPHIWQKIVEDRTVPSDTLVVSLAFGPGLTIAGALFQKRS